MHSPGVVSLLEIQRSNLRVRNRFFRVLQSMQSEKKMLFGGNLNNKVCSLPLFVIR